MIDFAPAPIPRPSLGDEIARLSAHIEAATGRLFALIRQFDASEEWIEEGFTSCAGWLGWRTHIGPATPDWEGDRLDTDWALSTLR